MANNSEKTEKTENYGTSFADRLNDLIRRHRKVLAVLVTVVLVLLAALIAGLGIRDMMGKRAIKTVEALNRRYGALRQDINTPALEPEVLALLDDLSGFAGKHSGYAGARAYSVIAEIYAEKGDWAAAEAGWKNAARAAGNRYLAPVSLFNAAAAAEEQGNTAAAIGLYTECLSYADIFPAAPRAAFSIGRLRETEGNTAEAVEAYNRLINQWPDDPTWPSLARSRIITLNIGKR